MNSRSLVVRVARWAMSAALLCGVCSSLALASDDPIASARKAVEESRFEQAKSELTSYLADHAESAEALFLLGRAESGLGNHKVGEEKIGAAIQLDGSVGEYYAQLGSVMIAKAQTMNMFEAGPIYMAAMEKYRQAVAVDPKNLHGHIGLCRYYWNAPEMAGGSIKKAKDEAAIIEQINPYLGKTEFALIAQKEGLTEDAIALFTELAGMNPGNPWPHYELGKLYQMSGKMAEAKAAYQKAVELNPAYEEAKAALAAFGGA